MSLLDDASIVVTPNGYKQGVLFSVIPSSGAADLEVTRGTAATRVDDNGLVNYAEVIGGEEVTDGNFPLPNVNWILGGGNPPTIGTNDVAINSVDGNSYIQQSGILTIGRYYKITYDVISASATSNVLKLASSFGMGSIPTSVGTQIVYGTAVATSLYIERYTNGVNATITNISVKEVTRDNVPRIDYTGGGCPHILAEPQRTNLVTDSQSYTGYFNNSGTLIYNNTISPDGLENGAKNYASTTGSFKGLSKSYGSTLNNTAYTLSIFAKAGEFDYLYFYNIGAPSGNGGVWFNLSTGNVGTTNASWSSAKMESFGNGWYRCSAVITPSGTSDNLYILLADANNSVTATSNGTDGYYIYGASLEEGSYATSYIPTSGSTVTRNQDIFTRSGIGSLINSEEGTIFVEMAALANDSTNRYISINDGSSTNRIIFKFGTSSNNIFALGLGTATSFNMSYSGATITNMNKIALKYKVNDCALWVNGAEVATDTTFTAYTANTLNQINLSNYAGSSQFLDGKVKQLQVFKTALSDSELETLTT